MCSRERCDVVAGDESHYEHPKPEEQPDEGPEERPEEAPDALLDPRPVAPPVSGARSGFRHLRPRHTSLDCTFCLVVRDTSHTHRGNPRVPPNDPHQPTFGLMTPTGVKISGVRRTRRDSQGTTQQVRG